MTNETRAMREELREAVIAIREAGPDDHFYGAWFGPRSDRGGHPATMERTHEHLATGGDVTHEQMSALYHNWDAQLTKPMADSLESYVGEDFIDVNAYLNGRRHYGAYTTNKRVIDGEIDGLDSALAIEPLPHSITVWHGGSGDDIVGAKVGDVIERKGYTSTSLRQQTAADFVRAAETGGTPTLYKMLLPAGLHGAYLDASFPNPYEYEYLIGRDTRWVIQSIDPGGENDQGLPMQTVTLVPA